MSLLFIHAEVKGRVPAVLAEPATVTIVVVLSVFTLVDASKVILAW